jgi:hypothetical protein
MKNCWGEDDNDKEFTVIIAIALVVSAILFGLAICY